VFSIIFDYPFFIVIPCLASLLKTEPCWDK